MIGVLLSVCIGARGARRFASEAAKPLYRTVNLLCFLTIPSRNGAANLTSLECRRWEDQTRWGASDEKLNRTGEERRYRVGSRGVLDCIHVRSCRRRCAGRSTSLHE